MDTESGYRKIILLRHNFQKLAVKIARNGCFHVFCHIITMKYKCNILKFLQSILVNKLLRFPTFKEDFLFSL